MSRASLRQLAILIGLSASTAAWSEALCVLCPDPATTDTTVSAGIATVDGVDQWRGSQLPWVDDGDSLQFNLDHARATQDGERLNTVIAVASDTDYLGELAAERQGSWDIALRSRGYGIRDAGGAVTPFRGTGGNNLVLPQNWETGQTTQQMPTLEAALRTVEIGTDHRDTELLVRKRLGARWRLEGHLSERKIEGERSAGSLIGSSVRNGRSVILPIPRDQTTRNVEVSGDYIGAVDNLSIALRFSEFRSDDAQFSWDNAFTSASRAPRGSSALLPDNQFVQLDLSGSHRLASDSHVSFQLAHSRASQDQRFQPYTVSPSLAGETLPRNSLNGELDRWVAALRAAHHFNNGLTVDIDYHLEDLGNNAEQDAFDYIIADFRPSFVGARRNLGYEFTQQSLNTSFAYPLSSRTRLQSGVELSRTDRSDRAVEQADEVTLWGRVQWRILTSSTLALRAERSARRGDDYRVVPDIQPPQNPLLRKYSLADQDRLTIQARGSHPLSDHWTLGALVRNDQIDYPDTQIGLRDTDQMSASIDLSYSRHSSWSASLFMGYDRFESTQYGSAAFAEPDWRAKIEDATFSTGAAFNWHPVDGPWGQSLEFSTVDGRSDISVSDDPFPEVGADLLRFVYRCSYQLSETVNGMLELWYERYQEEDWALQDIATDSVEQVLSLGEDVRDHEALAIVLTIRHDF